MDATLILDPEPTMISLRAYAESSRRAPPQVDGGNRTGATPRPSPWTLTFDTETTTDAGQALRFGAYQVRYNGELREAGLFAADTLGAADAAVLAAHATANGLRLLTRDAFVDEVFYGIAYDLRATIIGLNLPFDLSRLAISHGSARGDMRGGFSLRLSGDKRRPPVQVRHQSQRTSLIRFAAPFRQRRARSERKRGDYAPVRRGAFVDIRTLAAALFTRSFTLDSLAEFLKVEHRKLATDEHGKALTDAYVTYAVRDVQTTWECYQALVARYESFGLTDTPPHAIFSEASIGKAYLKAMHVQPWRMVQADAPPKLLATIMGSLFGGRSEVRIRRELRQVMLCDFLSMYPTVCTLMGLWAFVIARGMTWRDSTDETQSFLATLTLDELQRPETWRRLHTLVQVDPSDDVFPIRAQYDEQPQATIGLNIVADGPPLWFTLADCIASRLHTGRAPNVLQAITFEAGDPQDALRPVMVAGNPDYAVDPIRDEFFKRLIELRQVVKGERDRTVGDEHDALDAEQNALKIAANATSYGIFAEVNVKERAQLGKVTVHTGGCDPYEVETGNDEEPGRFFHPLLASLITGAARLMLAVAERLISDEGLEWSFCDTDSMAIAKPDWMDEAEFRIRVGRIVAWFAALNPYEFAGSILKVEDVNGAIGDPATAEPLFCWAVSAKRYALFNLDGQGRPVLRQASAHGLGHIRAPYDEKKPAKGIPAPAAKLSDVGVELWQHDLWWMITSAAIDGQPDQVDLSYHPKLSEPAVSRYGATTPNLLSWFKTYNRNRSYERQVKPFGFMLSPFADPFYPAEPAAIVGADTPGRRARRRHLRPIAPFDKDHGKALKDAFDRETFTPIPIDALRTVAEVVGVYHLHPESKFHNGDYLDRGTTRRRRVSVTGVRYIGKEANRWEEQHFLGLDEEAQPDYGQSPDETAKKVAALHAARVKYGLAAIAREAGLSTGRARRGLGAKEPHSLLGQFAMSLDRLHEMERTAAEIIACAQERALVEGLAAFARRVGMDANNLAKVLSGRRSPGARTITKLLKARRG